MEKWPETGFQSQGLWAEEDSREAGCSTSLRRQGVCSRGGCLRSDGAGWWVARAAGREEVLWVQLTLLWIFQGASRLQQLWPSRSGRPTSCLTCSKGTMRPCFFCVWLVGGSSEHVRWEGRSRVLSCMGEQCRCSSTDTCHTWSSHHTELPDTSELRMG